MEARTKKTKTQAPLTCAECGERSVRERRQTITLKARGVQIAIARVPVLACTRCGEVYLEGDAAIRLDRLIDDAAALQGSKKRAS